ncbi:MAG: fasciclin domain-containing protein [Chitinophagaceae bacterium]
MKNASLRLLFLSFVIILSSTRCGSTSSLLGSGSSLMKGLGGNANLSSFTSLLQTPGLDKILGPAMKGKFTMLAPGNNALSGLGADAIKNLTKPENISQLGDILKGHIIPGKLDAAGLAKGGLKSAGGKDLNLGGVNMGDMISGKNFNIIPVDKVLN